MHFIEQAIDDFAVRSHFVVTGLFATGMADTTHGRPQRGSRATHVQADLIQFVKCWLHLFGAATLEHDVSGFTVERDQARAVFFPDITHVA